ncbi:MAG: nitric oxide synthase [Flavobacteriales bacterium]|nr:nitric oxide synthase [Flavobacteriales bacterium]
MESISFQKKAEDYLKLCYSELNKNHLFDKRWKDVKNAIKTTGTYELLDFELDYGTKVAWRNSNKCIGRLFWRTMNVLDKRKLDSPDAIFQALFEHIDLATNKGNIQSTISVFNAHKGIRIWNPQLLSFAGYKNKNGSIIGDPKQLSFTNECVKLGWKPKMGEFDILPLVVQIDDNTPIWQEIPKEIITLVPIEHPEITSFKELGLKWYSTPIISNMTLEIGGIEFHAAPFNGWYMGTEIGARNLADESRYNMLPQVAKRMDLNLKDKNNLWKDRALVELNHAVLHSFKKHGVKIIDHHTASKQFMEFMRKESKQKREVTADWAWIVPPLSGSTMEVFHTEMNNVIKSPNYFYQKEPWV